MKYVQTTKGVQTLLKELGVDFYIVAGALCVIEIQLAPPRYLWGGFWGDAKHAWVMTEFCELVDLSISRNVSALTHSRKERFGSAPLWWDIVDEMPKVIKYFPEGKTKVEFSHDENLDLRLFLNKIRSAFNENLATSNVDNVGFEHLDSEQTLNALYKRGHEWAREAWQWQDSPLPDWVARHEKELVEQGVEALKRQSPL